MTTPLVREIKALLTNALSTTTPSLKIRMLEDALKLTNEIRLDSKPIKAIKAELKGDPKKADKIIQQLLKDIDKLEYGPVTGRALHRRL